MPQSLSKIYLHLVFSTKNRERTLLPEHRDDLYAYMGGILHGLGCPVIKIGGEADHVHLLFSQSRAKSVSDIVRELKSSATVWYQQRVGGGFHWQQGYGVFSVSQSKVETVKRYIETQEEHHRWLTFQEEYLMFLKEYGIQYDERYVWD